MSLRFTDKQIASLKARRGRYEVWDASRPAFGIRVGASGKKSWIFVYHWSGRPRRMTLGQYPRMSLADAGVALAEARRQLELGADPGASEVEKRRQLHALPTVQELGQEYLDKHAKPNKKSWREDQRILEHDVLPAWGARNVTAITRGDVNALLDFDCVACPNTGQSDICVHQKPTPICGVPGLHCS